MAEWGLPVKQKTANCRQHPTTFGLNMALHVGQCAAHANEVIYQHVITIRTDRTIETGLPREPRKSVSTGVKNHVGLVDAVVHRPIQRLAQQVGKNLWNGIHRVAFVRVGAYQCRGFVGIGCIFPRAEFANARGCDGWVCDCDGANQKHVLKRTPQLLH